MTSWCRSALVCWLAAACWLSSTGPLVAQLRSGAVTGIVRDASGLPVPGALVSLDNSLTGYRAQTRADSDGRFALAPVPFGVLVLRVSAPGLEAPPRQVTVQTDVPIALAVRIAPAAMRESVIVEGAGSAPPAVTATTGMDKRRIELVPQPLPVQALQNLVALAPGVTVQHSGLVHVRGVEDGLLFVVDGVPIVDRLDALHSTGLDPRAFGSVEIAVGHMPAEFGGRSAGVVSLLPGPGPGDTHGEAGAGMGSEGSFDVRADTGGTIGSTLDVYAAGTWARSARYLDPVDPDSLHNSGARGTLLARGDWRPGTRNRVGLTLLGGGANLDVPNDAEQQAAGQDQRESLRQSSQIGAWQRVWDSATVSRLAAFHHRFGSRLRGSDRDIPLHAGADRHHDRTGVTASLTRALGWVVLEGGLSATRIAVREAFTFAVTDAALATERFVSEPALAFTPDRPFDFQASAHGTSVATFVQGLAAVARGSLSLGLRFDRAALPAASHQLSPRLAAAVRLPGSDTTLRASVDRLFMPPQIENLLLASSDQARSLSPFLGEIAEGGAPVRPERVTAWEIGAVRDLGERLQLDVVHWDRRFQDTADPNVFFNTTIVFPNTVAEGHARGTDVRLSLRERSGWSAEAAYTYSRITHTGPITGGLFLTEEFEEIGPGTRFTPDHDQRHIASARAAFRPSHDRWWVSVLARYQDGVPLEVDDEALEALRERPGAELVDFERGRVRRWATVDAAMSVRLARHAGRALRLRLDVQNLTGSRYAYNFGNPFEGTHFGPPRLVRAGLDVSF